MNYGAAIYQIIEALKALKADKTIPAEYRNVVASSARRLQLEMRGAKTVTNLKAPSAMQDSPGSFADNNSSIEALQDESFKHGSVAKCVCTPSMPPRKDCPVHKAV